MKPEMAKRVQKSAAYASSMASKYLATRQKLAILMPLLGNEISPLFENSYGAHAFATLRLTLTLDLVGSIWAFTFDCDERAPSLQNIWSSIEKPDLHEALREAAAKPIGAQDSLSEDEWSAEEIAHWRELWSAKDRASQTAAFDGAYDRVQKQLPLLLASERATKIKKARSKTIAHYDMKQTKEGPQLHPLSEIGLKWDDPKDFLAALDPIIWDVVLVTTWGSYDTDGFERRSALYAADFWARLQGKPPVND